MFKKIVMTSCIALLAGCGDSPIDEVKNQHFEGFNNYTIGQILDNRGVCGSVLWQENKETKTVQYTCNLNKGKTHFSFDEGYANNLRNTSKQEGLKLAVDKTESEIERAKNTLGNIKEHNEIITKLLNDDNNIFILRKNQEYQGYIFDAIRSYSYSPEAQKLDEIARLEFNNGPLHMDFDEYYALYQYLIEKNDTDSGAHVKYKFAIEGGGQSYGLYKQCVARETYDAIQSLRNDKHWIDEINSKHNEEMKKICVDHLSRYEPTDYDKELENCISRSYKPDYDKLVRKQGLSEETTKRIANDCSEEKDRKIAEYHSLLEQYSTNVRNVINSQLTDELTKNKVLFEETETKLKFLESSGRKTEEEQEANQYAENNVKRYSLTHILKGEEIIVWEYNKISKDYIIKQMGSVQYEYGGKTMSTSLPLDVLIYAALNNVNDIDDYMIIKRKKALNKLMNLF
ncbi:hypothetical protein QS795_011855 [Providencia zhijiangensis]|uniref:Lipoprotein n=1 Tax=Providencia zhijiangensis TaxID=3053982 RepID=A0ABZ0MZZ4_9GAMM|nr:hypothetical protein [Providencia sp. D4759]WPA91171.1 hypothetical protein QS795_011855 [Providencia sp. D4759]